MRKILCALSGTLLLAACDTMPGAQGPEPFRGEFPAYRYSGWEQDREQAGNDGRYRQYQEFRHHFRDHQVQVMREGRRIRVRMDGDILFDLNSAILRPEARAIIAMVAEGLQERRFGEIDVNGYTDTSGTMEHNNDLSAARAEAVATELEDDGVDPMRIVARGFGESDLRVPTPDGVREPQNRRVEIVIDQEDDQNRR